MSKDKSADHFRQDRVSETPDREGLTGASPVGNRWRAQGFIDGSVRYLGTFDTEEEAHDAFVAAKEAHQQAQQESEAEWLANAPEYVYEGGIGRGARLNGTRYKLVSDELPQHLILRQIGDDDTLANDCVTLNRKYLKLVEPSPSYVSSGTAQTGNVTVERDPGFSETLHVAIEDEKDAVLAALHAVEDIADDETLALLPPEVADAILKAKGLLTKGTRETLVKAAARNALKAEVTKLLFANSVSAPDVVDRTDWLVAHLTDHGNALDALRLTQGKLDHQEGLRFLKEHTDIPHDLLHEIEEETVGAVFEREGDPSPELLRRMGWNSPE